LRNHIKSKRKFQNTKSHKPGLGNLFIIGT
jgi:hypothetical protein